MMRAGDLVGGLAAVLAAGCTARPTLSVANDEVYLFELGPSIIVDAPPAESFRLGAGDTLGQGIFTQHVVAVRAGQPEAPRYAAGEASDEAARPATGDGDDAEPAQYATGVDDAPSP